MSSNPFRIYNASAGSGKTYQLVSEYLYIILSSNNSFNFDQILAITFTNKAANEMKSRILERLFQFSSSAILDSSNELFKTLSETLELEPIVLHKRAKKTLKLILHNYAFFDISTIDKFNFRLLQTFAKDLKLPPNFEVVLDQELLLTEAVERVINKAGRDKNLTEFLVNFAAEKIDNDKSWDISYDLNLMGKLLFDENQLAHLNRIKSTSIKDFQTYMEVFNQTIGKLENEMAFEAQQSLELINICGVPLEAFNRGTLPKHFRNIVQKEYGVKKLYGNSLLQYFQEGRLLKKAFQFPDPKTEIVLYNKYLHIKEVFYRRLFLKNAYQNIVPLTLLKEIQQEIDLIQQERDQISIGFFNEIISKEIQNQPAPYIYERLGEKYRHYFIDEFQDTSTMQWSNLIPLIENAMQSVDHFGKVGSLMLVGDLKQAIYRWRGGEAEQFLNLINKEENPFVAEPVVSSLTTNYRSRKNIIAFNNEFFQCISTSLLNKEYAKLYFNGNKQLNYGKEGGLVQISFLEQLPEEKDSIFCATVLDSILESLKESYSYSDMCILTRTKNQGVQIANYLVDNNIPIISSETLLLKNNRKILFLINLINFVLSPNDYSRAFEILEFLSELKHHKHEFINQNLRQLDHFLKMEYGFNSFLFKQNTLFDSLEIVIKKMNLAHSSDAYLNYFMELVLEVEQKEDPSIFTFLKEWEKVKERISIVAPESIDAVQIMTIHKSKGLEFPVVIYPFASTKIFETKEGYLWMPIDEIDNEKEFLISYKAEVENYGDYPSLLYNSEKSKLQLDAYDLLYVALTRAMDKLVILTEEKKNVQAEGELKDYGDLFINFLKNKMLWNSSQNTYVFGNFNGPKTNKRALLSQNFIPYSLTNKDSNRFKIITKNASEWDAIKNDARERGNLVHYALGLIHTKKDIDSAIHHLVKKKPLPKEDISDLRETLYKIVEHPLLKTFFSSNVTIKNESEIITENGLILRPDRIVIQNNRVSVLDYKTGKKYTKYKEQLYQYADTLEQMGYEVENRILVYIGDKIITEFL